MDRALTLPDWVRALRHREPDLLVHDPGGPTECLIRSGQLVVASDAVEPVIRSMGRWVDTIEVSHAAKLATLRLRQTIAHRCVSLAAEAGPEVAVNHVHLGGPIPLAGGPIPYGTGARPRPVESPPAPPTERWSPPVTVAVLDTGLDPHPWFADRPWLPPPGVRPDVPDVPDPDGDRMPDQQAGHGTFVAGVLLRAAPGVTMLHRRVLSSEGLSDDVTVAAALRSIRGGGGHVDVVLLSAGCHTVDDRCPPLLARELSRFDDAVLVAAAGNGATARPFWPAARPEVLAVGATGPDGQPAPFSNHGQWVDAWAPGVDVVSSFVRRCPGAPDTETGDYGAASWSGTSFAAPAVAGRLAAMRHAGVPLAEARRRVCAR